MATSTQQTFNRSTQISKVFNALGDETRFKLYKILLNDQSNCVSELASQLNISAAGACQQLKVLEDSNLISPIRKGQKVCYKVNESSPIGSSINKLMKEE